MNNTREKKKDETTTKNEITGRPLPVIFSHAEAMCCLERSPFQELRRKQIKSKCPYSSLCVVIWRFMGLCLCAFEIYVFPNYLGFSFFYRCVCI